MKTPPKRLGRFGKMVNAYQLARRPYSSDILSVLRNEIPLKKPQILDLGCGTGISTRHLVSYGKVIGCDPDPLMIKAALQHKESKGIKYVVGTADKLPFKDESFDVVTAFAAFHWFNDKKSISEIRRVLKPNGIIFIVNRTGIKSWGEGYRKTIIRSIGQEIAPFREDKYQPEQDLKKNGFKKVRVRSWKSVEFYTLNKALQYVQSVSIWNTVPVNKHALAIKALRQYFEKIIQNKGKIERKLTIRIVIGSK